MVDNRDKGGAFALGSSVGHLLHRAQQIAADRFAETVADPMLTLRQFALLAAIGERAGQSQTALVKITGIDRSTLADMIRRLEERGLVARRSAEADKRANSVTLTKEGERTLKAAMPGAEEADALLISLLPKNRRKAFLDALQALAERAGPPEPPALNGVAPRETRKGKPAVRKAAARVLAAETPAKLAKLEKPNKAAKAEKPEKTAKPPKPAAAKAEKPAKSPKAAKALKPSEKKRKKKK